MTPYSRLSTAFVKDHPLEAARVLENFPAESVAAFLADSGGDPAEEVVMHFTPVFAAGCLTSMEASAAGRIFNRLTADFQLMLLRQLDWRSRETLLNTLPAETAEPIRRRLPYAEGTAGALMEIPLANVPEELSVKKALQRIKRVRSGLKFYIYVTNQNRQLVGVLTLHELINAPATRSIREVMHKHIVSISPAQPVRTVIKSALWQEYYALPVTDQDNRLLGVIRHKSLCRIQEQLMHVDAISTGLKTVVALGELFAVGAGYLLSTALSTTAFVQTRKPHD